MTPNPRQPPRINIEAPIAQPGSGNSLGGLDVVIPAHLLQTVNATVSKRDEGERPNWEPQRQLSVRQNPLLRQLSVSQHRHVERPNFLHRSSTAPSVRSSPAHSRAPSPSGPRRPLRTNNEKTREIRKPEPINTRRSWRLSFTPGDFDQIAVSPKLAPKSGSPDSGSFPPIEKHATHDFAKRHTSNPFTDKHVDASRRSSLDSANPFLSRNNSTSSFGDIRHEPSNAHTTPAAAYVPRDVRQRRGTLEAIVDTVVPNALQKRLTNNTVTTSGLTRQSSMRKTLEHAKLRGEQLQRSKWAMIAFEWGIYVLLLCFIYFVLIGIPLWNGAVWWLYWVVANKFVFAGGFSITLGIAVL